MLVACGSERTETVLVCESIAKNPAAASLSPGVATATFPPSPDSPRPVPAASNGTIVLTEANYNQQVTVPKGTLVEVVLENRSSNPWGTPQSSNPIVMPRLSASSQCVSPIIATFRASGPAEIRTVRPIGDMSQEYRVSIQLSQ